MSEKLAANAFWNGELEAELRERGALDMYGMFHTDSDREVIMERLTIYGPKTIIYIRHKIALMIVRPEVTDSVVFFDFNSFISQKTCIQ